MTATAPLTLWGALRHPLAQTRALHAAAQRPWGVWGVLTAIALGGSALYGASLAASFEAWASWRAAVGLTVAAGAGWLAFGPALWIWSRTSIWTVAHACMVAMAYGEALLALGAAVNLLLGAQHPALLPWNLALVGVANLAMGTAVAAQLQGVGVPWWRTALCWSLLLNGVGGAAFWVLFLSEGASGGSTP